MTLPPLPKPALADGDLGLPGYDRAFFDCYSSDQMESYARAAIAAVPAQPVLDCDIQPRPLAYPLTDYHSAVIDGPLHYTWQDKPHRLLYDLIAAVRYYAAPKEQPHE